MKPFLAHIWRKRWLYVRLLPLLLVIVSPGPMAHVQSNVSHALLPLVLFIIGLPILLFIWILLGPDDAGEYSLKELFFDAPMLPLSRSTCAIWTYLGLLSFTMALSFAVHSSEKFGTASLINFASSTAILLGAIGGYYVKRYRLTNRCS
jgi:hypothetical protein